MIDAVTAAAQMLSSDAQRLNVIGHNLANLGTPGFKRQSTVSIPFQDYFTMQTGTAQAFAAKTSLPAYAIQTDPKAGTLRSTGQPLDLAIEDNGFFEIRTQQGLAYTRRGDFHLNAEGVLVTHQGFPVMGHGGEIRLANGAPSIDKAGSIFENNEQVGQLKIIHFSNAETLEYSSSGVYLAGASTKQDVPTYSSVRQGYLEASNVTSMEEMVRLIETMRHFEAAQKIVQSYDEMLEKAFKRFGEL